MSLGVAAVRWATTSTRVGGMRRSSRVRHAARHAAAARSCAGAATLSGPGSRRGLPRRAGRLADPRRGGRGDGGPPAGRYGQRRGRLRHVARRERARGARAAHAAGALAWADAVHLAPHRRPDRAALGVDVLLCSPYKFFGPHLGIAAIRRDLAETWPADRVRPASETPPGHRFETGTPSFEALAGLVATVEYLSSLGDGLDDPYARVREHEEALARAVLERLAELPAITIHGIADPARVGERTPTFCLSVAGRSPREVSSSLAERDIYTWDGNYYALALMEALGLQERGGAVRAGFVHYNTADEAERLCDALADLA